MEHSYESITRDESISLVGHYRHAAHLMVCTKSNGTLFGRVPQIGFVHMQMRFDGYLGFPGGYIDTSESLEEGLNRELQEEMQWSDNLPPVTKSEHLLATLCVTASIVLHLYVKEVSLAEFEAMEKSCMACVDFGKEVLGILRAPLYEFCGTSTNGYGFNTFLENRFIGIAKYQLLMGLLHTEMLPRDQLQPLVEELKVKPDS